MVAMVAVLAVVNVGSNRVVPDALYVPWAWLGTAAVLAVAVRLDGRTATELGLGRVRSGLVVGGIVVGLTVAVMVVGALLPATQDLYRDDRVEGASLAATLFNALVRVPLGTVLLEEVAFRGALAAMVTARLGRARGAVVTAVLFGLWHVLPAWDIGTVNPVVADAFGSSRLVPVAMAVATTTGTGLFLWWLRDRSGSLLAPALAHWSTNGLGYVLAYLVLAWT